MVHVHCGFEVDAEVCATTTGYPCNQQIEACKELGMPLPYEGRDPRVTKQMEDVRRKNVDSKNG